MMETKQEAIAFLKVLENFVGKESDSKDG